MNLVKICSIWFSRRQLGLANGVVSMGMALGFMLGSFISATFVSPWLGGWRNVLFFYGGLAVIMSLPWYFARPAPGDGEIRSESTSRRSLRQTLTHVVRVRNLWLLGWALLGVSGCVQGALGYLPLYLRELGWPPAGADGALAAFHAVSMTFVIPIALWSDRPGYRKTVLMAAALMIIAGVGLLSVVDGLLVWVAVVVAGMVRDGFMAIFMTKVIETKGIGAVYDSTAVGFMMFFSGAGNLIAPPLGNSLAHIAPSLPFAFWAVLATVGLLGLYCLKNELGEFRELGELGKLGV